MTTMEKLDRVSALLDEVAQLSLGHPDRLRLLTIAEQFFEGSPEQLSAHQDLAKPVTAVGYKGPGFPKDPFAP
jgi:hypothetical protein